MVQEDKELLLKDLCARLPFRICANLPNHHLVSHKYIIHDINIQNGWTSGILDCAGRIRIYGAKVEDIKPYLRPMSSMTEEEIKEYHNLCYEEEREELEFGEWVTRVYYHDTINSIDWLNRKMFDHRGLIEKDLAIEVTKDNNPYK